MGKYKITIITHSGVGEFTVDVTSDLKHDIADELKKFPMLFFRDVDREHVGEELETMHNTCGAHTMSLFRLTWAFRAEFIPGE